MKYKEQLLQEQEAQSNFQMEELERSHCLVCYRKLQAKKSLETHKCIRCREVPNETISSDIDIFPDREYRRQDFPITSYSRPQLPTDNYEDYYG